MADYIDRDLFAREVNRLSTTPFNEWDTMGILLLLDTIPAADVQPVVHGDWIQVVRKNIYDEEYRLTRCTACGYEMNNEVFFEPWNFRYCPNCGAKMEVDDG